MVIYEVNLEIDNTIYDEYKTWLIKHIQEMLQFKGFQFVNLGVVEQDDKKCLYVSYFVDTLENLHDYLNHHAGMMRAQAIDKFGNQFSATRRVIVDVVKLDKQ